VRVTHGKSRFRFSTAYATLMPERPSSWSSYLTHSLLAGGPERSGIDPWSQAAGSGPVLDPETLRIGSGSPAYPGMTG